MGLVQGGLPSRDTPGPSFLAHGAGVLILLAIILGLVAIVVFLGLVAEYPVVREGLSIPCVEGLSIEEARLELKRSSRFLDLRVTDERRVASVPPGTVLEQAPICSTTVNSLDPVLVVVSGRG
jgi:beta-lactam-binding protein with PASTA domain